MNSRRRNRLLVVGIMLAALLGCASEQITGKPFVIREAKLPQGFPLPGPVGEVVIKDYPAYRLAQVSADREGETKGQEGMFMPLFNHIKRGKIPMTAPVEMGYPEQTGKTDNVRLATDHMRAAETMAFLYGESTWGQLGKDPDDRRVHVKDVSPMTVLSIAVRGRYNDAKFAEALGALREWVKANPNRVEVVGPPRYLCYNSPFMLWFLRYAEVQLPIKRLGQATELVDAG